MREYRCRRCGDQFQWDGWDLDRCDQPLTDETRPGSKMNLRLEGGELCGAATLADGSTIELCFGRLEEVEA